MAIWMSSPSVVIPVETMHEWTSSIDPLYERIYGAYSKSIHNPAVETMLLPRAQCDRETLAAEAIKILMRENQDRFVMEPKMLIDCHSSAAIGIPAPSYKLAALCGFVNTSPISLSGEGGTEVASAIHLVHCMEDKIGNGILISAVQSIVPPDTRKLGEQFYLADGAATSILTNAPIPNKGSFCILGVSVTQSLEINKDSLKTSIDSALYKARVNHRDIQWSIAHRFSDEILSTLKVVLPNSRWLNRVSFSNLNFGCADPLISLQELSLSASFDPSSIGILCFLGLFGTIGTVILQVSKA
jgi:hypothetical protein